MSFRVTVEIGPRTKTSVSAYSTAVNARSAKLVNGIKVNDATIAKWIEDNLQAAIRKLEMEQNV